MHFTLSVLVKKKKKKEPSPLFFSLFLQLTRFLLILVHVSQKTWQKKTIVKEAIFRSFSSFFLSFFLFIFLFFTPFFHIFFFICLKFILGSKLIEKKKRKLLPNGYTSNQSKKSVCWNNLSNGQ